ncbi:MAG TPA: ATP-binding protein [Acetobacteraceae bacterium]|nr:ATP-binding protein [Acetobacteraceae bacterium]
MGASSGVLEDSTTRRPPARWLRHGVATPLSVRIHMVGLILVVVTPLLVFSAFLVLRSAEHEQEITANTVRERTLAAGSAIDRELSALRARLFILAASHYLQAADLAAFRDQASAMSRQLGLAVMLSDPTGRELVDTQTPVGDPLPMMLDGDAVQRVVATGQPDISGLVIGAAGHQSMIALSVPVLREDQLVYVLSFNIGPAMTHVLAGLDLPPDWIVTISDRVGITIARNLEPEKFVGQMGRRQVIERFHATEAGWLPLISREGVPVYTAFARVKLAGWTVAVGIPDAVLFAPVQHSTMVLSLAGVVTLALALLLALAIARRVASPITALVAYADVVGRGQRIDLHTTGILETDAVARSLYQASERLRQGADDRNKAAEELRHSEQKYRVLAEDLAVANQERTELLHRTVAAQEEERTRIARDLHDSIGQYLTALRLAMTAIEPHIAANALAHQRLAEVKDLTSRLGSELSRMAWELRPMALDDLGLRRAVTQYLEEWGERAGLRVNLEIALGELRLPQAVETALFRVLQEAFTNVVKHSGADQVAVVLEAMDGEVRLIVEDNGRGFPLDNGPEPALGMQHLGLLGVRERLALVKGSLEVESTPQSGTTVYVRVPV